MTTLLALGPTAFSVLTWGSIALVGLIFLYELYELFLEYELL